MTPATPVLEVENLVTQFKTRAGVVKAVDGVSFSLARGEVLGLVGESGSGKSVTGYSILRLIEPPGLVVSGRVSLEGDDVLAMSEREMRRTRGRRIAMIFQDPMMTLTPVLRVDTQMMEAVSAHEKVSAKAARARALDALSRVGIPAPAERLLAYPHQLSGGMRQRVAIAIALLHRPAVIVADEPTTALDVTIQSQILAEVQALAAESGTAMIWITHDLAVVAGLADRLAVMYAGRVVEEGPVDAVLGAPIHPYTAGLLASLPSRNEPGRPLAQVPGMAPSLAHLPVGCAFAPRCAHAQDDCRAVTPPSTDHGGGRRARCHHPLDGVARAA